MAPDKMFSYHGRCRCNNVSIELLLTNRLTRYIPRACDCDFCSTRQIAYLSDPLGQLNVTSATPLNTVKQGSNQASFQLCSICAEVVCVTHSFTDKLKGAVNVKILGEHALLPQPQVASPKLLSPQQKTARWDSLWLSVVIHEHG